MLLPTSVILLALGVAVTLATPTDWENFKKTHGKKYSATEEPIRQKIWEQNNEVIKQHNIEADNGQQSFRLGHNKYSDMTTDEFRKVMNGRRPSTISPNQHGGVINPAAVTPKATTKASTKPITTIKATTRPPTTTKAPTTTPTTTKSTTTIPAASNTLPATVDWRPLGYVTPIKNQGQCGSCWAFSVTGALEGQMFNKTGTLVLLSEQNLVDCAGSIYKNYGCNGGDTYPTYDYILANKGIDTEASYPYEAMDDTCRFNASNVGATITGYVGILAGDEAALKTAVATIGPISFCLDASQRSFQLYRSGVYNEPRCVSDFDLLDHCAVIVGYGTLAGKDYWLVKNQWGTTWGDQGYIMMSRNAKNQCGVATEAYYPTV